jgi:hypothetical protein
MNNNFQLNSMNIKKLIRETVSQVLTEDYHRSHKEFRLFEGSNHIAAKFNDGSELRFEVHFRNNHGDDREKHRRQACSKWRSLASEIHGDIQLNEVGNEISKSWRESFSEALKHPDLQEFIRHSPHHKIYPNESSAPTMDPVNFTHRR